MSRLQTFQLFSESVTAKDALNNPITIPVLKTQTKGRMTSWTAEEIALLPRQVTTTQEKVIVTANLNDCLGAKTLMAASGQSYDIVEITEHTTRWTLIRVKSYGL